MFLFVVLGDVPRKFIHCVKETIMSYFDFRAYLKPKGSNPEIDSFFYELSSYERIMGMWNCETFTLGFNKGDSSKSLVFRPTDLKKPIVFAIYGISDGCYFVVIDEHMPGKKHDRMCNIKPFKTDKYLIDCYDGSNIGSGKANYWAITTQGIKFVYGETDFSDTWVVRDCNDLCAFIGGDLTTNELRAKAWRDTQESLKEESRERHIERLAGLLRNAKKEEGLSFRSFKEENDRYERLRQRVRSVTVGWFPFVLKSSVSEAVEPKVSITDIIK